MTIKVEDSAVVVIRAPHESNDQGRLDLLERVLTEAST